MKKMVYDLISKIIKFTSKNVIVGKKIKHFNKLLYYEKSQHLNFLFQPEAHYEGHLLKAIKKYIKSDALIFDIGANIGQYTIPFSELVGASGKVYAFEPDTNNFSFLQFNVNINACPNVICENYGVGGSDTEREFYRDTETGGRKGSFKIVYVEDSFKGFTDVVQLKKLDTIIDAFGVPDFVKVDVEGYEDEVILGLTKPSDQTVFFIEVRSTTKVKVFDYFKLHGFTCKCIDRGEIEIHKSEAISDYANLIFYK